MKLIFKFSLLVSLFCVKSGFGAVANMAAFYHKLDQSIQAFLEAPPKASFSYTFDDLNRLLLAQGLTKVCSTFKMGSVFAPDSWIKLNTDAKLIQDAVSVVKEIYTKRKGRTLSVPELELLEDSLLPLVENANAIGVDKYLKDVIEYYGLTVEKIY